jgi:hypothetical protein
MLQGSTENNRAREQAIADLVLLANSDSLYEIRFAAHYIVQNLSEHTNKETLNNFENEISKLMAAHPSHQDTITLKAALDKLHNALPSQAPKRHSTEILYRYEMRRSFDESNENDLLLAPKKSNKKQERCSLC